MTNNSDKAGSPRHKLSCFRRMTRSTRRIPHVMLSNEKGRANMVEIEKGSKYEIPDDTMWIQTHYWYKTAAKCEPGRYPTLGTKAAGKDIPTEYPKFPPDYFNLEAEDDGTDKFIELKGRDTICPGSPGYLPERVPIQKWFRESMWGNDNWTPYRNMVRYSRRTSNLRIHSEDAEKYTKEQESKMCWIEKVKWYQSVCEDTDT